MTTPCLYSIVRFSPYPETEEFANVGVVVCAPKEKFFDFQMTQRDDFRVCNFFHDNCIFPVALDTFCQELSFAKGKSSKVVGVLSLAQFFNYFTAKRESILHFSPARVVMASNPKAEMEKIYNKYVNHCYYNKRSKETLA
jgi:hypothetical protein